MTRNLAFSLALLMALASIGCAGVNYSSPYGIVGLIIFVLDIIAIVQIAGSSMPVLNKLLWILLILLLPLIGLIIWYLIGRK